MWIQIYRTTSEKAVIQNNQIGEKSILSFQKNTGKAQINKATVKNQKAIHLLLSKILLKAVKVIGIVMLKNNIARIPKNVFSKAKINNIADKPSETIAIFLNQILSQIIQPSIFHQTTANIEIKAKVTLKLKFKKFRDNNSDFHSKAKINPT